LADAITALAADPARCQIMGCNGRALVEAHFAEETVAHETLALYRAALAERTALQ
jgi:glycosyltransferase involved in cell wall biosynthesis